MGFTSILEIFSIGIGPSSSHTVGPMRAAKRFIIEIKERELFEDVCRIQVELYGSLAMTGVGHATDLAILLGLEGETPDGVDPEAIPGKIARIHREKTISLCARRLIAFDPDADLLFLKGKRLRYHSNAMRMRAFNKKGAALYTQNYYSIGGGFVLNQQEALRPALPQASLQVPFPFETMEELKVHCRMQGKSIGEIIWANEIALRSGEEVRSGILKIWDAMRYSVARGLQMRGEIPGGLGVKRRAADLYASLSGMQQDIAEDPTLVMEWVGVFALAVNEENAAGSRVVTAPTNGSSGVIPAVLHYCQKFIPSFHEERLMQFFLTASAMACLYKSGASISAAEMGCQGEIGVSSSMAAGGLAAVLGGTLEQIENAAEIAMEHHLGLTCDPPGGLVQIPCIERNAMGAIKAITAARLALRGGGQHRVPLDAVIRTMKETGLNMQTRYKETAAGGLALQVTVASPVC